MSDLSDFRDHARAMATAEHRLECSRRIRHARSWGIRETVTHPDPDCPGCVTDADRALWARLADEAAAYLHRHDEEGLFG